MKHLHLDKNYINSKKASIYKALFGISRYSIEAKYTCGHVVSILFASPAAKTRAMGF